MATPEGKVKGWLDKMLKEEGVWYYSPQAGPYGVSGIPDRIAIVCGLFVGMEVKANAKCKMTALQERCREQILNADGWHFLVYDKATIEEVREFIQYVRACNSRQEGLSGSIPRPRYYLECYPNSTSGAGKFGPCPAPTGGNNSAPEPGHPCSGADPLLLQLPSAVQSNGAPENHVSFPN